MTMESSSSSGVMICLCVLFLLPVLFAAAHGDTAVDGDNIILPACKTAGGGSTYFDVSFCLEALGSSSEGIAARTYRELAAAAVGLLAANATSTEAKIDGLLREGGGGDKFAVVARCLRSCRKIYGGIVDSEPGCAAAIKGGRLAEAAAAFERSAAAVTECEDGFGKSNTTSPLTAEGDDAFKLAKLTVALLQFA